jgi:Tol biopolymer transport system component
LFATWSPNGQRIIFSSQRDGIFDLYQKSSSGAGDEELLFKSNEDKFAQDWSSDGRFLLYSACASGAANLSAPRDLWVLPLPPGESGDRKPAPFLKTEFDENQGQFSPDGHFIAYRSNTSGRDEIYVQPFPADSSRKWTISERGGSQPRWSSDGKELFYVSADSKMMAVEVSTNPAFRVGLRKVLFQAPIWGGGAVRQVTRYDVTADGKKFLINSVPADTVAPAAQPITVVQNWTALLKK